MMRRQADEEGAAVANLGAVPGGVADHGIARKAATAKSRTKALARRLRKSSRMASLTADVSEGIEQIAGYSDGIIESFEEARHLIDRIARESRESAEHRKALAGISAGTREISGETAAVLEDLALAFGRREESLRGILSVIQGGAQIQNDIQKQVQELSRLNEAIDDISARLNRLLERADISGLNAVLEAGRAGESGAGFGPVAAMAQKAAAEFERKAAEASLLLERMKEAHGSLSGRAAGTAERIQAIGVMTKGVRNAFTEAEGVIAELRAGAEENAEQVRNAVEGLDGGVPGTDAVPEIAERAAESIELAATRLSDQEQRFAEAAEAYRSAASAA
jgi:methyl-accepting chemotaxis protein